jgi:polysaccharide export outer membrane protein
LLPVIGLSLAGCSSYIPGSGPKRQSVIDGATLYLKDGSPKAQLGYALIAVNAAVVARLHSRDTPPAFAALFTNVPVAEPTIGPGDMLTIEIFEAHAGGLFIPQDAASRPGNFVQLQPQQVDSSGHITVPYAGSIVAAGRTPRDLATSIRSRLKDRALDPQVIVTVTQHNSNDVSVLGDVNAAARFQVQPGGERVLSALARAGGPKSADYETMVRVQRNGRSGVALLSEIARNPRQNIQLQPGDVVYVSRQPRYFSAIGATGQTTTLSQLDRRFPFQDYNLTLNDAIARAGGLQDDRANSRGVFLFREESSATLRAVGLHVPPTLGTEVPTIYMVDLSAPAGIFYCNQIWMRNRDTIYVSNAPATDIQKFINSVMPWTQSAFYASGV